MAGNRPGKLKPDFATLLGLAVAALGIVGGLLLEGGSIRDVAQLTAAIIVIGGTVGAVMVNYPLSTCIGGFKRLREVFFDPSPDTMALIDEIAALATKARKSGIVSLEHDAQSVSNPFLSKALSLAVDGTDMEELRRMLELDVTLAEHHAEQEARVWESAGGYAPTVGILGAVMGLIQVMKNLADIDAVGHGIATAFVATVYGVAFSNLFFLPAGAKIKGRAHQDTLVRELIIEGVLGIVEGLNPKLVRGKLESYLVSHGGSAKPSTGGAKTA